MTTASERMTHLRLHAANTVWIVCLLFFSTTAAGQTHGKGLVLLRPDELMKVPPAFTPFSGAELPAKVDLSPNLPTPGDQGSQGSCVAWATAYGLRSYQFSVRRHAPLVLANGTIDSSSVFSPAFVYNQINRGRDKGSSFTDALDFLKAVGAVPLKTMPYRSDDFLSQPQSAIKGVASQYRISFWKRINPSDLTEVKSQLNAGYPVIIGATVDEGFEAIGRDSVWNAVKGRQTGGHAMVLVGYDDERNAFRILNSWGIGWGDKGYGWIAYQLFPKVTNEAFVAKDEGVPEPQPRAGPSRDSVPHPVPAAPSRNAAEVFDGAAVRVLRVTQNVVDSKLGAGIRFDGIVAVPSGTSGSLQVVIPFYAENANGTKGAPIPSASPRFSIGRNRAATGTKPFPLTAAGMNKAWYAFLPYDAIDLGALGTNSRPRIVAEPVLYVDRFGVKAGKPKTFTCDCGRSASADSAH